MVWYSTASRRKTTPWRPPFPRAAWTTSGQVLNSLRASTTQRVLQSCPLCIASFVHVCLLALVSVYTHHRTRPSIYAYTHQSPSYSLASVIVLVQLCGAALMFRESPCYSRTSTYYTHRINVQRSLKVAGLISFQSSCSAALDTNSYL